MSNIIKKYEDDVVALSSFEPLNLTTDKKVEILNNIEKMFESKDEGLKMFEFLKKISRDFKVFIKDDEVSKLLTNKDLEELNIHIVTQRSHKEAVSSLRSIFILYFGDIPRDQKNLTKPILGEDVNFEIGGKDFKINGTMSFVDMSEDQAVEIGDLMIYRQTPSKKLKSIISNIHASYLRWEIAKFSQDERLENYMKDKAKSIHLNIDKAINELNKIRIMTD